THHGPAAAQGKSPMELELSRVVDCLPGLVWTAGTDGGADYVNRRWLDYTGLTEEQAHGFGFHSAVHPDDLPELLKSWISYLETGQAGEVEARLRRHDGEYRRFNFSAAPIRDSEGRIVRWCGINTDIEDKSRAEQAQALRQVTEAQRLSQTGSFTADVWADRHFWSDELYRIFGIEPGTEISVGVVRERILPEDRPGFDEGFARAVAERGTYDQGFRILMPDGTVKYLHAVARFADEIAGRPLFIGAIRDVTESRVTENALRASEAELRQAYGRLTEAQRLSKTGSFTWDIAADRHVWSEEIYRIFGLEPGSEVSMPVIRSVLHPEDLPLVERTIGGAVDGTGFELELRLLPAGGDLRHVRVVARRMEQVTDRTVFIGALQDVTDSRRAEEALSRARAELAHVARATALSALTASIAHEVNQPLAGIVTNASTCLRMLASDPPNLDGARATAQRTIRDGHRASEIIQRLRGLFARRDPRTEALDLSATVREVLALCQTELKQSEIAVRANLAEGLPPVAADRVQLQQVILNLVLNAADAMAGIHGRARTLSVITARLGDDVVFEARDCGCGIDPAQLPRLFDPFYTTKPQGMGIGLSVSRSIIEGHSGRLWARNNDGAGATFAFSIPAAATDLQGGGSDRG
ncbi:MAG TPA: PAS domain-containing protein, partial [Allosphingosinicella sp.]